MCFYSILIKKLLNIIVLLFITSQSLCSQTLEKALSKAGINKDSLITVLNHYDRSDEKEKYEAALFLIKNLTIQESHKYEWIDSSKQKIRFSEFDYNDFGSASEAFIDLKYKHKLRPRKVITNDIEIITSNMLIENIDSAFKVWKSNPWSKSYSFETFCEYILPYRSLIEPLELWRAEYKFLVERAQNNLEDPSDPVEVCKRIMEELKGFSFFSGRSTIPSPLLSPQQLLFRRQGTCPELANLALLASRSLGVATTFDFTPHYGASSNRHYWNTVIDKKGKYIPFNGSSASNESAAPYNYNVNNKRIAKIFRKTYSIQNTSLATKIKSKDIPKSFLKSFNIIDVTNEYVPVGSIKYKPNSSKKHTDVAYLNVFNLMRWKIVDWAEKKNTYYKFNNLGKDLVYLVSYYENGKNNYAQYPILLTKKGKNVVLKPNLTKTFKCTLSRYNERIIEYEENNSVDIEIDEVYKLFYWDKTWQNIGTSVATRNGVNFKNIPSSALMLLKPSKPDGFERIFIIDENTNEIIWY